MKTDIIKKLLAAVVAALMLTAAAPAGALARGIGPSLIETASAEALLPGAEEPIPCPAQEAGEPAEAEPAGVRPKAEGFEKGGRAAFDVRIGGEYVVIGAGPVMLSTLLEYFDLPRTASNVASSDASSILVEDVGGDWRITVLRSFSGYEYVTFTAGGLDYGFDLECGRACEYVDRQWEDEQIVGTTRAAWNPTDIAAAGASLTDGWYVSEGSNTVLSGRLDINGEVSIILTDGSRLHVNGGVRINPGAALRIYGGPNDSGLLYAHPSSGPGVGNGGAVGYSLLICGGTIDAKGGGSCAGIGGGSGASGISYLTINGGNITAKGGSDGPGIGRGYNNTWLGEIAINGGTVEAEGGENGAGIGGGKQCGTGPLTVNGGKVTVTAGELGAGIGGGANCGQGSPVTINGGEVNIYAPAASGAGIGGGAGYMEYLVEYSGGNGGSVNINGGKTKISLQATRSAGIGGGGYDCNSGTLNGNVTITGGELRIEITNGKIGDDYVKSQGAGIGGAAERTPHGDVIISGGYVRIENYGYGAGIGGGASEKKPSTAGNGGNVRIGGDSFVVSISSGGAGIGGGGSITGGGGGGNGGTLTIDGGAVHAISGEKGAGVGGGNDGNGGTLIMNDGFLMAAGGCLDYNYFRDHGLYSGSIAGINPADQGWANLFSNILMHFFVSGDYGGAGIGGGDDGNGGTVIINGGRVVAQGGRNSASAIGRGDGGRSDGSLTVYNEAMVSYAQLINENNGTLGTETLSVAANREKDCKSNAFAYIRTCQHPGASCESLGESGHLIRCSRCRAEDAGAHPHSFEADERVCSLCGFERVKLTLLPGDGSGTAGTAWAPKGARYTVPGLPAGFTAPGDKVFFGWLVSSLNENNAPGNEIVLNADVTLTAQWTDPYNLWVGGVQVTEDNRNDVLGDGKVSYDPATSTLNLSGIEGFTGVNDDKRFIYANRINLRITGSGELTPLNGIVCRDVIYIKMGSLTIDGDFTIANTWAVGNTGGTGLNVARDVIFEGGNIAITAAGNAVSIDSAGRKVVVKNGVERLEAATTSGGTGFYAFKVYSGDLVLLEDEMLVTEYTALGGSGDYIDLTSARRAVIEHGVFVTFELNGGSAGEGDNAAIMIAPNGTVTLPEDPSNEGFGFGGWYLDEGFTQPFDPEALITGDISLFAMWTVEFEAGLVWSDPDVAPNSVTVALQRAERLFLEDGSVLEAWSTVDTIEITGGEGWRGTFAPVTYEGDSTWDDYRVRELDMFGELVPGAEELGGGTPMAVYEVVFVYGSYAEPERAITLEKVAFAVDYASADPGCFEIRNADTAAYTVENAWEIDLAGGDRPDGIEVALQKRTGLTSWETLEVMTLNAENGWSCAFAPVPTGRVAWDDSAEAFSYRVRQLGARDADADSRIIHDKWDLDKPCFAELLAQLGSDVNGMTDAELLEFVMSEADPALVGEPTAEYRVDAYTDVIGRTVEAHDTKYYIEYGQAGGVNAIALTDIAVLDVSVNKRWIGFEDGQLPSSVLLMLVGRPAEGYAEQTDAPGGFRPVPAAYGAGYDAGSLSGLGEFIREGVHAALGGADEDALDGIVVSVMREYLTAGLAAAEAGGTAASEGWEARFGVKKYGGIGVPMEFAGAELPAELTELAADALLAQLGEPALDLPAVLDPANGCWSIKGRAVACAPDEETDLVCSVVNALCAGDACGTAVGGTVYWADGGGENLPESVLIHVFVTGADGERTEAEGSPVVVSSDGGWVWALELPQALALEPDGGGVLRYGEITIEEEVPTGYEASYAGYDVVNRMRTPGDVDCDGTVTAADALLAMRHAMAIIVVEGQGYVNGDMDGDDELTTADAILIMRLVLEA